MGAGGALVHDAGAGMPRADMSGPTPSLQGESQRVDSLDSLANVGGVPPATVCCATRSRTRSVCHLTVLLGLGTIALELRPPIVAGRENPRVRAASGS